MQLNKLSFNVFNTIDKYNLINPNDTIIVGVSGGPDSVALLKVLYAINTNKRLHLHLIVAHLNHQLRGKDSEEDALFIQKLSEELHLPFILKNVDVHKIAIQTKCSIEEAARGERYKFFIESSRTYNASVVALGHTADDNAETILHRIIRGTGLSGLEGIPIKRQLTGDSSTQLIRPLLYTWRNEIIEYLKNEQADFRIDTSNYETKYLRNKIRHELIPLIENQYNPNFRNTLLQLSQILNINNKYLSSEAKKTLETVIIKRAEDSYIINSHLLSKQSKIIQYFIFYEILMEMQIPLKEFSYAHYTKIIEETSKKGKGRQFQLPGKLHLWHEKGILYIRKTPLQKSFIPIPETIIQIPGITPIYPSGQLTAEISDVQNLSLDEYKRIKTKNEEILDLGRITLPISVRGRKDGDAISPLGTKGHKKLKDIFIDKKIPAQQRNAIPVVVMNDQPIWVIGVCIDNKVKVTPETKKILKLTFQKL